MAGHDLVLRARRVILPEREAACRVGVTGGRVTAIEPYDSPLTAARIVELADDEVLLPGLVDAHVHVNEPGRTEWEGFASATRAAAAGGVTTLLDMPLNSIPPTTDVGALATKREAADGQCHVDTGFWGGIVPGSLPYPRALHDAGVFGFKSFLVHSGVDEFPHLDPDQLDDALAELATFDGLMLVHAEDAYTIGRAPPCSGREYSDFLASRPAAAEDAAIARVVESARRTGARVHILHLSSCGALPLIASARREGVRVTAETCPHYLTFAADDVPDGATELKCCPPVREAHHREQLWEGLAGGVIDSVVSDHSPCVPALKRFDTGDFGDAWGGISSLQVGLPAVWTQARSRGHDLTDVARWMATSPARVAGLRRKGAIAVGHDADFAVFAPDESFVVDPHQLQHKNPVTPYAGRRLAGVVRSTWLRGEQIVGDQGVGQRTVGQQSVGEQTVGEQSVGKQSTGEPRGRLLNRGDA